MVLLIIICGLIYGHAADEFRGEVIRGWDVNFCPWYFSVVTFTTIGYGDYAPLGTLRGVTSLEGFLGLFLMAVFTVSFARKFIR